MSIIPRSSSFDIDSFFDHFLTSSGSWPDNKNNFFSPRIDLKEKGKFYEVTAELPGVEKDNIHISLDNGVLTIEAESKQEDKEEKDGKIIRQERRYGKFMRSFSVGGNITEKDIDASFKNGVLHLKVPKPKTEKKDATRRISIK